MRTSARLVGLLVGLALTLLLPQRSSACSCTGFPEFDYAVSHSAAIFLGEVLEIRPAGPPHFESVWVKLHVEESWKGPSQSEIEILTAENEGICGYRFIPGERYLVYALASNPDPTVLWTHLCWRTHMTYPGDPDVIALRATPTRAGTWGAIKLLYR
jgi:hypothetical protein